MLSAYVCFAPPPHTTTTTTTPTLIHPILHKEAIIITRLCGHAGMGFRKSKNRTGIGCWVCWEGGCQDVSRYIYMLNMT